MRSSLGRLRSSRSRCQRGSQRKRWQPGPLTGGTRPSLLQNKAQVGGHCSEEYGNWTKHVFDQGRVPRNIFSDSGIERERERETMALKSVWEMPWTINRAGMNASPRLLQTRIKYALYLIIRGCLCFFFKNVNLWSKISRYKEKQKGGEC